MKPHFTLDDILPKLRKARITKQSFPRKAIACCPAHNDNNPSLSLSENEDGKVLWYCHAGCSQRKVQDALEEIAGVKRTTARSREQSSTTQPLTISEFARAKRLNSVKLHEWGVREQSDGTLAIPFFSRDGEVSAVQYRLALTGEKRFKWRSGDKPIIYGLWRISEWDPNDTLYLCEACTDTWSMWSAGLQACGIPSASTWYAEWWDEVKDFHRIVLIPDTDSAGAGLVEKLANTVPTELASRVYVLRLPDGIKDVNELWVRENAEPERFKQALAGCEIILLVDSTEYQNSRTNDWLEPEPDSEDEDDEPLFVPITELLARSPARELEYVPLLGTDGLIARGTITLIGAHPKAGKTTLLVHACREWVQQNLRVVYLTEDPEIIWRERVKEFPELHTSTFLLNDFSRKHPERWVRKLRKLEPDVVVVDTIRRFVPAKDENDSASVSVALAPLVDLVQHLPRTAIVLVHHTKKNLSMDGEITDIAGSHAYTAEVDTIFLLQPVRENKHQRILTPVAGRFWKFTPEPLVLELSENRSEYRVLGTVADVLPLTQAQNAKQKVLNAIKVLGKATAEEVAEYLRAGGEFVASSHLRNMLAELVHEKKLLRTGDGKRGNPYIYSIVPNPTDPNGTPSVSSDVLIPPETEQQNNNPDGEPNLFALPTDSGNKQSCNQATEQPHDSANGTPTSTKADTFSNAVQDVNSSSGSGDEPLQHFAVENNPPSAAGYELPEPETAVGYLLTALALPERDNQPTQHNPTSGETLNQPHGGTMQMMEQTKRNNPIDSSTLFRSALQAGFPRFTVQRNGKRLDVDGSYAGWKTALPTLAQENVMREAYLALNRCRTRKETQPIAVKIEQPDSFTFTTYWRMELTALEWVDTENGKRLKWVFRTLDDNHTLTAITKHSTNPDSKFARWVATLLNRAIPTTETIDLSQLVGKVADGVVVHKQNPDGSEQLELFNLVRVKR